ncbi:MAG: sulfatase [Candidatus Latescibacteria bacterium]|jgi:arylsulfatase A-like enzyme|nr:sulfatase [Candidatus Latescibacterota bacterium]
MNNSKPNVVYILTDQWRAKATGYNGDPNAVTPNIDRLAAESINFANAIGTSPVCTPARAALLTGRFPTTTGMFMNDVPLSPDEKSIGKAFKAGGYDTAYIGKWHVDGHGRASYIPPERRQGFDYWKVLECTHDYQNSEYYDNDNPEIKTWEGYDACAQTEDASAYVKQRADSDKPFFLMLSLGPPHFPHHNAPEEYQKMFSPESVTFSPNVVFDDPEFEAFTRKEAAGYYAHIAALDKYVGDLVEVLKESGLKENTILIFASDHGEMMGSHNNQPFMKQIFWDESCRVPFLLRYPPLTAGGENQTRMTPLGTVDIMPTLLGLCGLDIPDTVEGRDLSACVREQVEVEDHVALYMSISPFSGKNYFDPAYRALRTNRYTFVRTSDDDYYLFDDVEDPFQLNNLADDSDAVEIRKDLEQELVQQLDEIDDPFREKEYYLEKWGYEIGKHGEVPYSR